MPVSSSDLIRVSIYYWWESNRVKVLHLDSCTILWKQESGLKISVVIYTGQENVCEAGQTLANDDGTRIKNLTCTGRNNVENGNETSQCSDDSSVYILSENGSEKTFDITMRAQLKCIDSK